MSYDGRPSMKPLGPDVWKVEAADWLGGQWVEVSTIIRGDTLAKRLQMRRVPGNTPIPSAALQLWDPETDMVHAMRTVYL